MLKIIDTESWSDRYRKAAIDPDRRRLLITNFRGTEQEKDLSEPANCAGFGRIRHFRRGDGSKWPVNPLPIEPARRALGLCETSEISAQIFQNAVCNWRCWYCFVPFSLLNANPRHASWLTPGELIELYLADPQPPPMIDLSGGQPDLTPEWVPWMMEELTRRNLARTVYLWSDDNLSNDYFWRHLTPEDHKAIKAYGRYGRVACFKGIDRTSFTFNTAADPLLYDEQFELFRRFLEFGLDLYGYVTFTTPDGESAQRSLRDFTDRLQRVHPLLPLRVIPLEVLAFTPVQARLNDTHRSALSFQYTIARYWRDELHRRYAPELLRTNICDVRLTPQ